MDARYLRKVQPEMPSVIVLAEYDLTITSSDGVAELVPIPAPLKDGSCDAKIRDMA